MFSAGLTSDSTDQLLLSLVMTDEPEVYSIVALPVVAFFDSSKACRIGVKIPVHPVAFPPSVVLPLLDELPREELYLEGRLPP